MPIPEMLLLNIVSKSCTYFVNNILSFKHFYDNIEGMLNWSMIFQPEDHWSCIAHLSAEDMLKSAVVEEKKFKHSPSVGADNPLGPKF